MSSLVRISAAAFAALLCLLGPYAAAQEAPEGTALYIMVLRDGLTAGPEPDVAALGGTILKSRMNRRLVAIPPEAAEELERHARVAYLQRIWDGTESVEPPPVTITAPMRVAPAGATTVAWESNYTYDGSGNIATAGSAASGAESYAYDLVGRLVTASVKGTTESYAYDTFGNLQRTPANGPTAPAISTATNQIVGRTYDALGNQLTVKVGAATAAADYDALGMVVELPTINGSRRMIYTADDERIAVVVSNGVAADERTEIRVRDLRGKVLTEWHTTEVGVQWIRDYVYAENRLIGGARQVGPSDPAGTLHYHLDHLGSIRRVTTRDGVKVSETSYLPFGSELPSPITEPTAPGGYSPIDPAKFTGHERDYLGLANDADGDVLDYMHARYYDGRVGRFLSVDPERESVKLHAPQSWNRYSYALNNPVLYVDPDGRATAIPWGGLVRTGTRVVVTQVGTRAAAGSAAGPVGVAVASAGLTGWEIGRAIGTSTLGGRSIDSYVQGALLAAMAEGPPKSLDEVLIGTVDKVNKSTGTTILTTTGTYGDALQDFNDVVVADTISDKGKGVLVGTAPDGKTVVVRPQSSDGPEGSAPTLEVQDGKTKTKQRYREREDEPGE